MKHIKVLEKAGFIEAEIVPSEKGGPPKKMYKVNQSFSLRLDLGPELFKAEHRIIPSGGYEVIKQATKRIKFSNRPFRYEKGIVYV